MADSRSFVNSGQKVGSYFAVMVRIFLLDPWSFERYGSGLMGPQYRRNSSCHTFDCSDSHTIMVVKPFDTTSPKYVEACRNAPARSNGSWHMVMKAMDEPMLVPRMPRRSYPRPASQRSVRRTSSTACRLA